MDSTQIIAGVVASTLTGLDPVHSLSEALLGFFIYESPKAFLIQLQALSVVYFMSAFPFTFFRDRH